jgi:hypothetical protein
LDRKLPSELGCRTASASFFSWLGFPAPLGAQSPASDQASVRAAIDRGNAAYIAAFARKDAAALARVRDREMELHLHPAREDEHHHRRALRHRLEAPARRRLAASGASRRPRWTETGDPVA